MKTALLVGANLRAMFWVARKLWQQSWSVDIVDFEPLPIQNSKYIRHYHKVEQTNNFSELTNKILTLAKNGKYNAIIPINDVGVLACNSVSDLLKQYTNVIIPSKNAVKYAQDKYKLLNLSLKHGFANPKTIYVETKEDLQNIIDKIPNSVIVAKSCCSKKINNETICSYSAFKTSNKTELLKRFDNANEFPIMIQQCISGTEIGYNFYAENGNVKTSYFDKFYRGSFGTESTSRQSLPFDNNLANKINALIKSIEWNGVGMFDIIISNTNVYILELNGRFWASVDLSGKIQSGLWEQYANYNLDTKLNIPKPTNKIITIVNATALLKNVVKNCFKLRNFKETILLLTDMLKAMFSRRFFIQEKFLCDFGFYAKLHFHYIQKLFNHDH